MSFRVKLACVVGVVCGSAWYVQYRVNNLIECRKIEKHFGRLASDPEGEMNVIAPSFARTGHSRWILRCMDLAHRECHFDNTKNGSVTIRMRYSDETFLGIRSATISLAVKKKNVMYKETVLVLYATKSLWLFTNDIPKYFRDHLENHFNKDCVISPPELVMRCTESNEYWNAYEFV